MNWPPENEGDYQAKAETSRRQASSCSARLRLISMQRRRVECWESKHYVMSGQEFHRRPMCGIGSDRTIAEAHFKVSSPCVERGLY